MDIKLLVANVVSGCRFALVMMFNVQVRREGFAGPEGPTTDYDTPAG